jgi:hypothetical protein
MTRGKVAATLRLTHEEIKALYDALIIKEIHSTVPMSVAHNRVKKEVLGELQRLDMAKWRTDQEAQA